MTKKERYEKVFAWFKQNMGEVETELHYGNPFQLRVAVMLSAQCNDKRVNMVTPALFAAYPDALAMSKASEEEILSYVKSVTYPNAKAKHLLETAKIVAESYGGEVPDDDKLLQKLPGVGRKTAHVVQAVLFNRPEMPVDTHVFRLSHRFGWVSNTDNTPEKVEAALTFLDRMCDEEMLILTGFGLEGVNYEINENGNIVRLDSSDDALKANYAGLNQLVAYIPNIDSTLGEEKTERQNL